jgi:photoactive yellow protein
MDAGAPVLIEPNFDDRDLFAQLDRMFGKPALYDELRFGLIVMQLDGTVLAYNRCESEFSGISKERCIGLNFFSDIAPCTNNYLVSGRFEAQRELDETIDYVFTLKMRPTRVQLRLLKAEPSEQQYLVVRAR